MEGLKVCPFCGGEAKVMDMGYPHWVYCKNCGAKVHGRTTDEKDSIKAWNRRVLKKQDVPDTNVGDTISRQAAIDCFWTKERYFRDALDVIKDIRRLPSAQPEVIRCKDCKYFELDHFEKVEKFPIPIIVAHEVCTKWGNGCQSSVDGWCFMAERRTDETDQC